ncbi:4Fe-4S dicluster domain-containing protein [Maribellus luteus]|uniref:4Fe-4S dicluster domain-containing protein n=1 Tax=Maribellus luteus TaxID=2305463 RepID=A0A399STJ5_9BACT|nr:NAD(P)-binding domain-containing protein [Maribellus luteus]RIJ47386.1 4Fe-4S dicluster domain-containing protein [Maribellus luteus]
MESFWEKIWIYGGVAFFLIGVLYVYIRKLRRESKRVEEKIRVAKEEGLHEPVSLHPVVDVNSCIQSGACIRACPEHDILGIRNGKATVINASRCVGHGACFHACPTQAISLFIGTEKRGVDLPHVNQYFESNVKGIFIAGEMGGMGLIRNAVEQGRQAVNNLAKGIQHDSKADYDLVVVGAGPAGISATLEARRLNLKTVTLEQDTLGGTVASFPRSKIVMTSPMDLPLHGKVKLFETQKTELLDLWQKVTADNGISIQENKKVDKIEARNGHFKVFCHDGEEYITQKVLLAIGRRGTPRKLNVPGEDLPKVYYRLLEPEFISDKDVLVVGGGDSAVESALLLAPQNRVTLSYRKETFSRLKPKNKQSLEEAISEKKLDVLLNSNVTSIGETDVSLQFEDGKALEMQNDLVYIFAGGELPTEFLKNAGIAITRKFGEAILKHERR